MKRFLKFGKNKKSDNAQDASDAAQTQVNIGYTSLKEKDLGKLHKAAWQGDLAKVKQLAKKESSPLDKENRTPLHLACAKGHAEIVEELIAWKAKPNVGDSDQCTPLARAVQCHKDQCAKLLLEGKADPNVQDRLGDSCLHYCANEGLYDMASMLLQKGANPDIQNKEGRCPLHLAVLAGQENMCQILLEEGANINAKDTQQRTALMYACQEGNVTLVKLFLQQEADTTCKDAKGWTADDCAVIAGQHACSQLIADYTMKHRTPRSAGSSARDLQSAGGGSKKSTPVHKTQQKAKGDSLGFGAPAIDKGGDFSEDSVSRTSDADRNGADDSWGDSDDQLPLDTPKAKKQQNSNWDSEEDDDEDDDVVDGGGGGIDDEKKSNKKEKPAVPGLNLAKLLRSSSNESLHSTDQESAKSTTGRSSSKIPKMVDSKKVSSKSPPIASKMSQGGSKSKLPQRVGQRPDSSRSVQSQDSWQSSNAENSWNSGTPSPAPIKKTNALTPMKKQTSSGESDDDNVHETGTIKKGAAPKKNIEEDEDDASEASERKQVHKKVNLKSGQKGNADKSKQKDILAELGMSDLSEVSDPSGLDTGRTPRTVGQESDWDSAAASQSNSPVPAPGKQNNTQKKPQKEEEDSDWDSEEEDEEEEEPKQPVKTAQGDEDEEEEESSEWDSDVEDAVLPKDTGQRSMQGTPATSNSPQSPSQPSPSQQSPSQQAKSRQEQEESEESEWDSDDNALPSERDGKPSIKSQVKQPVLSSPTGMYGSDDGEEEEEEEEEEESEWERDRQRLKAEADRVQRWEQEEREREEKQKRAAEEELRREKEDEDRRKREEEERRKKEELEKQEKARIEKEMQDEAERKRKEEEVRLKKERQEKERQEKERLENEKLERERRAQELKERLEKERKEREESMRVKIEKEKQQRAEQEKLERERQEKERAERVKREQERLEAERRRLQEEEKKERERQEKEREERFKKEQERLEAQRLKREEEERLEEERQEKEQQELLERVRRELEDREEQERMEREQKLRSETPKLLSDVTDCDQDRSQKLKERREKAERELEEARLKQRTPVGVTAHNTALSEDDNSSLDGSELLVSPQNGKVNGFVSGSVKVGGSPAKTFEMNNDEDDGLSYSSTDNSEVMNGTYSMSPYLRDTVLNTSANLNDSNLTRLQDQLREQSRRLEKEHTIRMGLENRKKSWERDRADLNKRITELSQSKSSLEQIKLELEARLRNYEYSMSEESEKRKNAEVLLNKVKEQLARKESQFTNEIEAKQKIELGMRNLQMENRVANSSIKQLEEERDDLQRQLKQEKNARAIAEQLSEEQSRLQHAMQEETSKSTTQKFMEDQELAEVVSKFESADEGRRQALENIEKLKTELYKSNLELDVLKKKYRDEQTILTTENEDLQQRVEDARNEIKLNEEALTHASMQYNIQIGNCKTENSLLSSNLEREKSSREKLETELESMKSLLSAANLELEKTRLARNELEKSYQKDKEDWEKVMEKKDAEVQNFKESNQSLSERYGAAEAKFTAIENELRAANNSLMERNNHIASLQREFDQKKTAHEHLDQQIRKEKELNAKLQAKLEAAQERVTGLQHEMQTVRQQFDDARSKDSIKERAALDTQDKFSFMLSSLRNDHDKSRGALEEKNNSLNETVSRLRDDVHNSDSRRVLLEQEMRHLQQELTETAKKLSVAEASLEVTSKIKEQAEAERTRLGLEIEKLHHRLESSHEKEAESKAKISELTDRLEQVEQSSMLTTQQLANTSANAEAFSKTKLRAQTGHRFQDELEDTVHKLEVDKARLEAALNNSTQKVDNLQLEIQDSNRVRQSMEALLSNLKTANAQLEEKVTQEAATRSILAREAEDSRDMWETEVKSRSKLGLRLAQLERAKQEAQAVVDEEKRKTRKAVEMKKVAETKLDAETERRGQLEKDVMNLKTHLKTAKKRLKDLESSESRISSLHSEFDRERLAMEGTMQTLRRQLDELQSQLNEEIEQKDRYEAKTRQLQQELNALKTLEKSFAKLERTKRKMETDFDTYKNHVNNHYVDKGELQRVREDHETKLRQEMNSKLQEVNGYLEDHARARERLDAMRNNNESQIRTEYEKTKKDLMDELSKLRAGYSETVAQNETKDLELQRYKEMYENEVGLRERLATRLQKATDSAANTKAQLSVERQKALMLSASPPMARRDNQWVSPLGPMNSPLGTRKATPGHGINDSLSYKIKNELDKSIAKHLESAGASSSPVRPADDSFMNTSFGKSTSDYMATLRRNYFV